MNSVKKRKLKYGSLAVGLTVALVAFIIVLNAVFSALASHFFWYFDMTPGQIYQFSERASGYLDKIDKKENDIVIYFLTDKDNLNMPVSASNTIGETSLWGMKPIHELALQISDKYDFISVDYINLVSQPDKLKKIVGEDTYATTNFASSHILFVNNTYERNSDGSIVTGADGKPVPLTEYKLCARSSFYLYDYASGNVNAFRGDYYFVASIMSLTKINKPTVYFLTGHGEQVGDVSDESTSSYGASLALYYLFDEAGCKVKKIDLQYDNFEPDDKNAIVVVYGPQRDITSSATTTGVSESDKLRAFLDRDGNSLMMFVNSASVKLSGFEKIVNDYCGLTFADTLAKDSGQSSVSHDGYSIVGKYESDKNSPVYNVVNRLTEANMANKSIFTDSLPIIADEKKTDTSVVVYLPDSANGDRKYGKTPALMTLTELNAGGKILVCASTDFANNVALESDIYSNKNLLFSAIYEMNVGEVPVNIDMKIIRSEGIDRTEHEARVWTLIISAVIPAIVATVGFIVYVRRKHS